jgi:hypothetical protein
LLKNKTLELTNKKDIADSPTSNFLGGFALKIVKKAGVLNLFNASKDNLSANIRWHML